MKTIIEFQAGCVCVAWLNLYFRKITVCIIRNLWSGMRTWEASEVRQAADSLSHAMVMKETDTHWKANQWGDW